MQRRRKVETPHRERGRDKVRTCLLSPTECPCDNLSNLIWIKPSPSTCSTLGASTTSASMPSPPPFCRPPALRFGPRRVGPARLAQEAEGSRSTLIKTPDRILRHTGWRERDDQIICSDMHCSRISCDGNTVCQSRGERGRASEARGVLA